MRLKRVIEEGGMIPHYPFYQYSYSIHRTNIDRVCVICYPIGIHLIARIVRRLYIWFYWNIDLKISERTNQEDLEFLNSKVEYLQAENKLLREQVMNLRYDKLYLGRNK